MVPNRIVLISQGRHDEAIASAVTYPGMLLQRASNGQVAAHAVVGGGGDIMVVEEDALRGLDITQALLASDNIPFRRPVQGDELLMLLQNGQNVTNGQGLMSAGDGTLMLADAGVLYEIEAPSSVITNTASETAFSNGSYTIPANTLAVGDVIHIRSKAFLIAVNSTNTHEIKLYIGATPVTLADSGALALIANDYVIFDLYVTVRTITSSGTIIADGILQYTISGTTTTKSFTLASTTLDSTVAETIVIKSTASAASTGNQIRLDEFRIDLTPAGGNKSVCYAAESINNSIGAGSNPMSGANSGTAAFIRCLF